ncbi:hypothetical protein [Paenibacillus sp. MSJ-34]|uniref:hypothetical protein n=1 Tax=Paenibacillus sp. MSJ-34 TaxID=2841529 RepID=UPI001C0F91A4|nr:hypothetical protein [Paenibacillus sp. MSJ-34]MBU5444058.1 hypothetical protein [Paenibacillus sp. MSJ-34]
MRVIIYECKKAFRSPILIALLVLFCAFNIYVIWNESYRTDELKIAGQLAETYGIRITDESLRQLEADLRTGMAERHGKPVPAELQLKGMYWQIARNIDSEYEKIDWNEIANVEIAKYRLSGRVADMFKSEYGKLSQRFEAMKEQDEHKTWFFAGKPYRMHGFLFASVFRPILYEALILVVLATALIANYEFENKTYLVTYSTRRGRLLMKDKLAASLLTATGMLTVLLAVTLGFYFSVFDYSRLWGSSISSALNWEYSLDDLPYVSWWNLSFAGYLLCSVLLVYLCMLLLSGIVFFLSVWVKNSYFAFFLFAAFFVSALLLPSFVPSPLLLFIAVHNLSVLFMNPHVWFMGNGGLTMFQSYEPVTVGSWTIITAALCMFSLRRFQKQEIH